MASRVLLGWSSDFADGACFVQCCPVGLVDLRVNLCHPGPVALRVLGSPNTLRTDENAHGVNAARGRATIVLTAVIMIQAILVQVCQVVLPIQQKPIIERYLQSYCCRPAIRHERYVCVS